MVHNPSTTAVLTEVSLSGNIVTGGASCTNFASSYNVTTGQELDPGDNRVLVTNLNSGLWRHVVSVSYGANEYDQYQRGVVIKAAPDPNDPNDPNDPKRPFSRVDWMYYANSVEVDKEGDAAGGDCSSNCTFRNALAEVNALSTSVSNRALIFFSKSPGTMTQGGWLSLSKGYVTIDGTDSTGQPWIVGDTFDSQGSFSNSLILANNMQFVVGTGVVGTTIKGLDIRKVLDENHPTSLIVDLGTGTRIESSLLDGGAGALEDCDLNDIDNSCNNAYLVEANETTLVNVEARAAFGQAIAGSMAHIADSRLHGNLGGHVSLHEGRAERSIFELAGFNLEQDSVNTNAFGIGGPPNSLVAFETNANIVRNNSHDGIVAAPAVSDVVLMHDYVCGNGGMGLELELIDNFNELRGTGLASAYNQFGGVHFVGVQAGAVANFDDDNAFTANDPNSFGLGNDSSGFISAINNQWRDITDENCFDGSDEIVGGNVDCDPAQDWLDGPITLDPNQPVAPTNATRAGQIVRVHGVGFNAIHGNPLWDDLPNQQQGTCTLGASGDPSNCCRMANRANFCAGTPPTAVADAGNCVAIRSKEAGAGSSDTWAVAELEGITPTTLTFGLPAPISCIGELDELVRVSKIDGDEFVVVREAPYCHNGSPRE